MLLALVLSCVPKHPSSAIDLTGSTWNMVDERLPSEEVLLNYPVTFARGGKLEVGNERDTTPDNDRWEQRGDEVMLYVNDSYVVYTGHFKGSDRIVGTTLNINDKSWPFLLERAR